jgi:anti-anti-sigma regulatory factor
VRTDPPRRPPPGADEDVLVVPVCRRRDITGVGLLVAYLAVTAQRSAHVVCDVGDATRCETDAVGALARIALEGRRRGVRVWVRNPSPALVALVDLVGLGDALPVLDEADDLDGAEPAG